MQLDDKAKDFIIKAKQAGKSKEDTMQFLASKGYDVGQPINDNLPQVTTMQIPNNIPMAEIPTNIQPIEQPKSFALPQADLGEFEQYRGVIPEEQLLRASQAQPNLVDRYRTMSQDLTKSLAGIGGLAEAGAKSQPAFELQKFTRPLIGKEPFATREEMIKSVEEGLRPQTGIGKVSKFSSEVAPYALLAPQTLPARLGVGATTGIAEYAREAGNIDPMAGVKGAAIDLATLGTGKVASKVAKQASPALSQLLSGIPEAQTKRLIGMVEQGKDVFKGKIEPQIKGLGQKYQSIKQQAILPKEKAIQEYYKIADDIKDTMIQQNKKLGETSGKLQTQLNETGIKIPAKDVSKNIDDILAEKEFEGVSRLSDEDINLVKSFKSEIDKIGDNVSLGQLNNLKTKWQNKLSNLYRQGSITSEGEATVKRAINNIRQTIYDNAPDKKLFEANEAFSQFRGDVVEQLQKKLTGKSRDKIIKNLETLAPEERDAIRQLDNISGGKISKQIEAIKVKEDFSGLVDKTIRKTDLKNPLNMLNKTDEELELIKQLDPKLYDDLLDLRARAEFDRAFSFQRSPYVSNRLEQEQAIQLQSLYSKLLGSGATGTGFLTGGLTGAAIGAGATALGTAATSPRLQAETIQALIKGGSPQTNRLLETLLTRGVVNK